MLVACGNANASDTVETTEHSHTYNETITTEATCETDGEKSLTCECGDTYTEVLPATGHVFENYISNEDATYLADGTETATCNGCELTDTRTAEGSKLEYSYTDLDLTMYAKQSVNTRDLPSTDGNKLDGLEFAEEVHVTGQCEETSWYRIERDGAIAYVSDSYLVDEKPEQTETSITASTPSTGSSAIDALLAEGYVIFDTPTPSGKPGDIDGNGVLTPDEESKYIDPTEQILISAGYGNVVQIDATTYGMLTPDSDWNNMFSIKYLREYLNSIGIYSNQCYGGWIDSSKGYYRSIAYDCVILPQ